MSIVLLFNNVVYSSVAATTSAILVGNYENVWVMNNYVEGFSGSGGVGYGFAAGGVVPIYMNNKWFNCATGESLSGTVFLDEGNAVTSASGLTAAGSGDFNPTSELSGLGVPTGFQGVSPAQLTNLSIGAVQAPGGGSSTLNMIVTGSSSLLKR